MYLSNAEKRLKNHPNLLALYYYRIIDNLKGKQKINYYYKFAKKMPFRIGVKYLFVHVPNRLLKRFMGKNVK